MGLVNRVVPLRELRAEVEKWCAELLDKSPTALALAKQSFNVDSEQRAGVAQFAHPALGLYYQTEEALEGRTAFVEKRPVGVKRVRKATKALRRRPPGVGRTPRWPGVPSCRR